MNLLEHYILEVYDVKEVKMEGGWSFVLVDLMNNCYGQMQRKQESFATMEEWEEARSKGYYLA